MPFPTPGVSSSVPIVLYILPDYYQWMLLNVEGFKTEMLSADSAVRQPQHLSPPNLQLMG